MKSTTRKGGSNPASTIKYLTETEIQKLLSAIDNVRDRAIFRVAYHRGLRASEVGKLDVNDYDPADGLLTVGRSKRGQTHRVGVTDAERKALTSWLRERGREDGPLFTSNRGTAITRSRLDQLMKQYCEAAGIHKSKAHFHALRHSCATHLLDRGAEVMQVKRQLGHTSINSTMIYAAISDKTAKRFDDSLKGWK